MNNNISENDRIETTRDIIVGVVRLCGDILEAHGEDTQQEAILLAGISGAIKSIDTVSPNFRENVVRMLNNTSATKRKYDA